MKHILLFLFSFHLFGLLGQTEGSEIGFDGYLGASNISGTFGIGAKYGVKFNEYFIAGPSFRYQRTWVNINGVKGSNNIYGGGGFLHARFYNALFLGTELEFLKSPFNYTITTSPTQWVPVFFVGGGFSKEFNESWRLNAGIMYDVINHANSPFRQGYIIRRENGTYIPVIYRIAFFFPI